MSLESVFANPPPLVGVDNKETGEEDNERSVCDNGSIMEAEDGCSRSGSEAGMAEQDTQPLEGDEEENSNCDEQFRTCQSQESTAEEEMASDEAADNENGGADEELEEGELEEGEIDDDDDDEPEEAGEQEEVTRKSESEHDDGTQATQDGEEEKSPKKSSPNKHSEESSEEEEKEERKRKRKKKKRKKHREEKDREGDKKKKRKRPKYIDHDRIDDDYQAKDYNTGAWPGFSNRSPPGPYESPRGGSHSPSRPYTSPDRSRKAEQHHSNIDRSPPGPYDSPYESPPGLYDSPSDEDDEYGPPSKMPRYDKKQSMMSLLGDNYMDINVSATEQEELFKKGKQGMPPGKSRKSDKNKMYRDMQREQKRKKVLLDTPKAKPFCKFYMEGKCSKGADCQFSHDFIPPKKNEICKFYLQGYCSKGDGCLFMHRDYPCKFHHTGQKCYQGDNCKFSHAELTEEGRAMLDRLLSHDNHNHNHQNDEGSPPKKKKVPTATLR